MARNESAPAVCNHPGAWQFLWRGIAMSTATKSRKPVKPISGSVKLRHATPNRNLFPIIDDGLLCAKAEGRRKVVWLHAPAKTSWAMIHTVGRHGGRIEDVIVLEVDVPRS